MHGKNLLLNMKLKEQKLPLLSMDASSFVTVHLQLCCSMSDFSYFSFWKSKLILLLLTNCSDGCELQHYNSNSSDGCEDQHLLDFSSIS